MAALLGLPAAREASSVLAFAERELAELANAIRTAQLAEMRAFLKSGSKTLTETWSYPWRAPDPS